MCRLAFRASHARALVNGRGSMWLAPRQFGRRPWTVLCWLRIPRLLARILLCSSLRRGALTMESCECRRSCNAGGGIPGLDIRPWLLAGANDRGIGRWR
jgi:hypothetical protein